MDKVGEELVRGREGKLDWDVKTKQTTTTHESF